MFIFQNTAVREQPKEKTNERTATIAKLDYRSVPQFVVIDNVTHRTQELLENGTVDIKDPKSNSQCTRCLA
jgi:hypothetical protein